MPRAKYKKRPDGRYQTKVYLGTDGNGKAQYKYVYAATVSELERKAEEIRYPLHRGTNVMSGDLPFNTWADRFLFIKKGKVTDKRYKDLQAQVTYWKKLIGNVPLSKLVCSDLQMHLDVLGKQNTNTKKPSSRKTLVDYRCVISSVFKLAMADRAVSYNPAESLTIPDAAEKKQRRALSEEEQRWIIETEHRAQTAAMIMMLAGLRRGELIPLQVMDVDLEAATISVNKSVSMVDGHPHIKKGGKTANATRTVNIPPQLVRYLRPLLRARSPFDLVCTDKRGRMLSESAFSRMWESYLCDLNFKYGKFSKQPKSKFQPGGVPFVIPRITPHMLRHTCATNMILAGMDAITVKDQLGHADIQTTLNIYTHVTAEHKKNEIDKLGEFLAARSIG